MLHWLLVISTMTLRLSVRPKQLRWVKTIHLGSEEDLRVDLP
jgi:1,2-diacylglycerol 3-beta-glucosyltransferase